MRKKNKKYSKSLRMRLFALVNITIFLVISICVIFNALVFKKYYIEQKKEIVFDRLSKIEELVNADLSHQELRLEIEKLCVNANIQAMIYNNDRKLVYTSIPENALRFKKEAPFEIIVEGDTISILNKESKFGRDSREILETGNNYMLSMMKIPAFGTQAIELYAITKGNYFVIIQSSMAPIAESVVFSNRFLIFVGIVVWIIAAVIVTLLSNKLVKPLRRLSEIARRMADMDFSHKYEGEAYDEVGVLGESMNTMSENLEKTISNLKTANAALLQDIDKKEKIDRQRNEFMSNVSHELKTPISIIEAYAEGLNEMELDETERRNYCDVILDEAGKMNVLIKKLMSLMRLESGRERLDITRFDITEQIREILEQKSILLQQSEVTAELETDEEIYVWADDFLIEEAFVNYLTNAIKYCSGERKIKVGIEKNDGIVRVNVFNTGDVVDDSVLENVWKSFYMADSARTRDNGSQGLGLSIVSAIMKAHNQKYGAYNTDGGIVFYFELDGKTE